MMKKLRTHIDLDSRWVHWSVALMGLAMFLRAVYYFVFVNLNDLDPAALLLQVVLPMAEAAALILLVKGFRINSPVLISVLMAVFTVNYFLIADTREIVAGIFLACTVVLFAAASFGMMKYRFPVIIFALIAVCFRVIGVDWMCYIQPIAGFDLIGYVPVASNLFGYLAIGFLCPALRISQRRTTPVGETEA